MYSRSDYFNTLKELQVDPQFAAKFLESLPPSQSVLDHTTITPESSPKSSPTLTSLSESVSSISIGTDIVFSAESETLSDDSSYSTHTDCDSDTPYNQQLLRALLSETATKRPNPKPHTVVRCLKNQSSHTHKTARKSPKPDRALSSPLAAVVPVKPKEETSKQEAKIAEDEYFQILIQPKGTPMIGSPGKSGLVNEGYLNTEVLRRWPCVGIFECCLLDKLHKHVSGLIPANEQRVKNWNKTQIAFYTLRIWVAALDLFNLNDYLAITGSEPYGCERLLVDAISIFGKDDGGINHHGNKYDRFIVFEDKIESFSGEDFKWHNKSRGIQVLGPLLGRMSVGTVQLSNGVDYYFATLLRGKLEIFGPFAPLSRGLCEVVVNVLCDAVPLSVLNVPQLPPNADQGDHCNTDFNSGSGGDGSGGGGDGDGDNGGNGGGDVVLDAGESINAGDFSMKSCGSKNALHN